MGEEQGLDYKYKVYLEKNITLYINLIHLAKTNYGGLKEINEK